MKSCKHASCGEVCKYPPKKKKKFYRIRHTAVKRAVEKKDYLELRISYLRTHKMCECGCGRWATEIHHKKGKIGKLLTDTRFFLAVCRRCHRRIGDEPQWAIEMGYSISRHKKTDMKKSNSILTILALVAISFTVLSFSDQQKNYPTAIDLQNSSTQQSSYMVYPYDTVAPKEKEYPMSLTSAQWDEFIRRLNVISNVLKTSNIPSQTTTTLVDSLIYPMQALIVQKVGPLVRADSSLAKAKKPSQ